MTDTEDRIAHLERAIRIHTSQITALESDNARLREEIELMGKRKALPYLELVPRLRQDHPGAGRAIPQ